MDSNDIFKRKLAMLEPDPGDDLKRRALEALEHRVGMTLQTAVRAETMASLATTDDVTGGALGAGGDDSTPGPHRRARGYMKPPPFRVWRRLKARGWEIYVPKGAVRGPGGEELECLSCDVVDSPEHKDCKVLPAETPGVYKMCVVRCIVGPGEFPQDFCGTESPSGKLMYNVFLDGTWTPDGVEWHRESPDIDVAELGVPAGQKLEGVVWFCPNPVPKSFDYDDATSTIAAGKVVEWGAGPGTAVSVGPYTLPSPDYSGDVYLLVSRTCTRVPPASEWTDGAWGTRLEIGDSSRWSELVSEGGSKSDPSATIVTEWKAVPLYHLRRGHVETDYRVPVSVGGGNGGGGGGDSCEPDAKSVECDTSGSTPALQIKGWKTGEPTGDNSVGKILSGDGGTGEANEKLICRQTDGTLVFRAIGTVTGGGSGSGITVTGNDSGPSSISNVTSLKFASASDSNVKVTVTAGQNAGEAIATIGVYYVP